MAPAGVLCAARHHQCQRQRSLLNWIQQSEDSPIPSRTCACPPASPPCSWLSTLTPGFLEQLTTGWPGPSSVNLPLKLVLTMAYWCVSGSLVAGLVHNIWVWCRPGLPSELTEDLIDSDDEEERAPPNPFDWFGRLTLMFKEVYLHIAWFWLSIYFCVPFKYLLTHFDVFSVEFRWD